MEKREGGVRLADRILLHTKDEPQRETDREEREKNNSRQCWIQELKTLTSLGPSLRKAEARKCCRRCSKRLERTAQHGTARHDTARHGAAK